jgi:hypothetical protein
MAIVEQYRKVFEEICEMEGIMDTPLLLIGVQSLYGKDMKHELVKQGVAGITTLDLHDEKADWIADLNEPIKVQAQYNTIWDVGCLEHVFDTRTCLDNYFRLLKVGGLLFLHTVVNTMVNTSPQHGIHQFNPKVLSETLRINGFQLLHESYCDWTGKPLTGHMPLGWYVARKMKDMPFVCPQQIPPCIRGRKGE